MFSTVLNTNELFHEEMADVIRSVGFSLSARWEKGRHIGKNEWKSCERSGDVREKKQNI